jgi:hypothetical protein
MYDKINVPVKPKYIRTGSFRGRGTAMKLCSDGTYYRVNGSWTLRVKLVNGQWVGDMPNFPHLDGISIHPISSAEYKSLGTDV